MRNYFYFCLVFIVFSGCISSQAKDSIINHEEMGIIETIPAEEFKNNLDTQEYVLIDIRTKEEFLSGKIEGAENIDYYKTMEFNNVLKSLDKNKKYLLYCRSGARSAAALSLAKTMGFKEIYDLGGGIISWNLSGFNIVQ